MFGFKKTKLLGGVKVVVTRDDVEGRTFYHHPHDKDYRRQGVFLYIGRNDHLAPYMRLKVQSGPTARFLGNQPRLLIRSGGTLSQLDATASRTSTQTSYRYQLDRACDEADLRLMASLARSKPAVIRFKGDEQNLDFALARWNRRLIDEMLAAFAWLRVEVAPSQPAAPEAEATPQEEAGSRGVVSHGPFRLGPDGAISDGPGEFRFPAGVTLAAIQVENYAIESRPGGYYVITNPDGSQLAVQYANRRWMSKPL